MTTTAYPPLDLAAFEELLGFRLDPFQAEAVAAYLGGHSVLVAAPTRDRQDRHRRVRGARRAQARGEGALHHPDQGALEPEAARLP